MRQFAEHFFAFQFATCIFSPITKIKDKNKRVLAYVCAFFVFYLIQTACFTMCKYYLGFWHDLQTKNRTTTNCWKLIMYFQLQQGSKKLTLKFNNLPREIWSCSKELKKLLIVWTVWNAGTNTLALVSPSILMFRVPSLKLTGRWALASASTFSLHLSMQL